jgi:uncharacterized protein YndB with AHSA1/START domain
MTISIRGDRLLGTLRSDNGVGVVRMEDRFHTDIDDLWSALTDPDRLARWIVDVEGDLRLGGEFRAHFTSSWEGTGRVETCEPPQRLMVTTVGTGELEECTIEATLTAHGSETRLVVEERGLPVPQLAAYGSGWQVHIEDLAAHLAGRERCDFESRWAELTPSYRDLATDIS